MTHPFARFALGIMLGLAIGLVYGWLIRPVQYVDTTPDSLRQDYRTDYVLMVAEAYQAEGDLELARVRLAALGPEDPEHFVTQALEYAVERGFSRRDLEVLDRLAKDLRALPPTPEIGGP